MKNYSARTAKIKRKYGADCFHSWGVRGGNPALIAQREGRLTIHGKRKRKSKG